MAHEHVTRHALTVKGKMQPKSAEEVADRILAHVYEHVDAFRAKPSRPPEQFAAAGLMRCCALLKGILVLDEARMPGLAGILAREHWETWCVSLYVLFEGDEGLRVIAGDDIYWKRRFSEKLRLERDDYQSDWTGKVTKLNYRNLHDDLLEQLRKQESVDDGAGVTGYDATYRYESLVSAHANLTTIGGHLVYGDDDEWAVSVNSSQTSDDVAVVPVLYTVHLAHYVFREFGLNGDAMDPFVSDLVVQGSVQEQDGN